MSTETVGRGLQCPPAQDEAQANERHAPAVSAARRPGSRRWLRTALLLSGSASASGCALVLGTSGDECATAADCPDARATCQAGLCSPAPDETPPPDEARPPATPPSRAEEAAAPALLPDREETAGGQPGEPSDRGQALTRFIALVGTMPPTGAKLVDPATDVVLEFDTDVSPGAGDFTLVRRDDKQVVEVVPASDARAEFNGRAVVLDFDAILGANLEYSILVSPDAVVPTAIDPSAQVAFPGITIAETVWFRSAAVEPPGNVGSGLRLWLDADHAPSMKLEGDTVRTWADRAGSGLTLRQDETSARPIRTESVGATRHTVVFSGANQHLTSRASFLAPTLDAFVVWRSSAPAAAPGEAPAPPDQALLDDHGSLSLRVSAENPAQSGSVVRSTVGGAIAAPFGAPLGDSFQIWNFALDATLGLLTTRAGSGGPVTVTNVPGPSPSTSPWLEVGAGAPGLSSFEGELAEVVVYDRPLSADERATVAEHLARKWGLALPRCGTGGTLGPSGRCYFLESTRLAWADALARCQRRGAGWSLAAPLTIGDSRFAASLLSTDDAWLAGQDTAGPPEQFYWIPTSVPFWSGGADGLSVAGTYTNWNAGEPNEVTTQNRCVRLLPTGLWADYPCTTTFSSLCEGPTL